MWHLFYLLHKSILFQNEPGIQEVWDTVRRVRCLWEGNINKALTVNFSVDMLNQEIVTFSGDTATARLDIQIGRGPFAPIADGLVKIGETMTLVVSVEGDPGFDLQVRYCIKEYLLFVIIIIILYNRIIEEIMIS